MLTGKHLCNIDPTYGDWRIDGKEYVLHLEKIKSLLKKESKKLINFNDIGYKGKNMNPELSIIEFKNKDVLSKSLSDKVSYLLDKTISLSKDPWLVVPGGSTPVDFFDNLSSRNIDWNKVHITLTDERWVKTDSSISNEALVRNSLLKNKACAAKFHGLKTNHGTISEAFYSIKKRLEIFEKPDVLIVGMGLDGHTASMFPNDPNLAEYFSLVNTEIFSRVKNKDSEYERITLNYNYLSSARNIILLIHGLDKMEVLNKAMEENNPMKYPISVFFNNNLEVYWSR